MLRAIGRHRAQNILQLAPQTRVKRKLQVDEAVQHAASAIRRSDVDGCNGNYHSRGCFVATYNAQFSRASFRNLHSDCALLAELACDISRRRGWFLSAAQIPDNEHRRS